MRASGQYTYGSTTAAEKKEKIAKKKDLVDSHLSEDLNNQVQKLDRLYNKENIMEGREEEELCNQFSQISCQDF